MIQRSANYAGLICDIIIIIISNNNNNNDDDDDDDGNDNNNNTVIIITRNNWQLASCLINAQPFPAHRPAADDNSLIGCTSCHDLTDDWSLPSAYFVVHMPISLLVRVRFLLNQMF